MILDEAKHQLNEPKHLLALHSSSKTLGVASTDLTNPKHTIRSATFPLGRNLSNCLLSCVEEVLPASQWSKLSRIAVATGPGSFTGTRLTIVMARTLAQQIDCPLDGVSSFALMAHRLVSELTVEESKHPFWIMQDLYRRGRVAGQYSFQIKKQSSTLSSILELKPPFLLPSELEVSPVLYANDNVGVDVEKLLEVSISAHKIYKESSWKDVLPIYPTSPVKNL